MRTFGFLACSLLLISIADGCGRNSDDVPRVVVCGTITYQGKAIPRGEIHFTPTKGSKGPVLMADIVDGKFRADSRGGVPVAMQKVEIFAYRPDPRYTGNERRPPGPATRDEDWPPKQQYLPPKYNTQSQLEITIESGSREITRDFALTK